MGVRHQNKPKKEAPDDEDLTTIKETINTLHEESGSVHLNGLTPQCSKDQKSIKKNCYTKPLSIPQESTHT